MPKTKKPASDTSDSDSGPDDVTPVKKAKTSGPKTKEGEVQFQLSRMRFVKINEFRGKVFVNLREFYEKDGEMLPGKKGIALNIEQWNKLKSQVDDIDKAVKELSS